LVISDALGLITFANAEALTILKESSGSIVGRKWVHLMMANTNEGTATKLYLKLFEEGASSQKSTILGLVGKRLKEVPGTVVCIGEGSDRVLLTTWHPG